MTDKKSGLSPMMIVPPLVFAGFAALFFFGLGREGADDLESVFEGKPHPPMTDVALTGYDPITPELLASGEVTVVNFWASWCPPCRLEHPTLLQMQADGLNLVGVNFKDTEAQATSYLADEKNPFDAVAFDPAGRFAIEWGVTGPPETFILDGDGTVLFKFVGPLIGTDYHLRFVPALEKALQ